MAEMVNKSRRVFFPKGQQRLFLKRVSTELNLTHGQLAALFKISSRTLSDWKREKFSISEDAVKKISRSSSIRFPSNIEIREPFWSVKKAARLGALVTIKRYGAICTDEEKRKKGWYRWWREKGRFLKKFPNQPKSFHAPGKSTKLAEFIGIMLGDGGITDYQIGITLNKIDDWAYANYVSGLVKNLFRLKVGKTMRESVVVLTISRKNLVKFLCKTILIAKILIK